MKKNKFYVYVHYRLGTNEIFYVGKGCNNRANAKSERNKHWHNIVNKYDLKVEILHDNLDEQFAFELEANYIACYGRHDLGEGLLVNMTDGWDGATNGERNHMYKRRVYDVWIEKYGKEEADKREKIRKEKISIAISGKNHPTYGKHLKEKTKKLMSISRIKIYRTEESRIALAKAQGFAGCWLEHKDGRKVFVKNQHAFTREYNLSRGHVNAIINKKRKYHKGWKLSNDNKEIISI